jgi:hypothetical protein
LIRGRTLAVARRLRPHRDHQNPAALATPTLPQGHVPTG